jgi:hypothetical protein
VLVLMDGRSVYTPLFAGTYWEVQDTLLEDIDPGSFTGVPTDQITEPLQESSP